MILILGMLDPADGVNSLSILALFDPKLMPLVKVFLDCLTLKIMTSSSLLELPDPKDDDTSSCLLGLPDSGDEITTLLQNVGNYLTVDTTLLP